MAIDIASETLKVGNALASVRIEKMILDLAKGIAWGQYELDKVGVEITKMMGVPGMVSIGGEKLSMLEAGFIPSFYHFVDTILELKMEVQVREEQASSFSFAESMSQSTETEVGAEASFKAGFDGFLVSAEVSAKASYRAKNTSAYSRSVDASHSQKLYRSRPQPCPHSWKTRKPMDCLASSASPRAMHASRYRATEASRVSCHRRNRRRTLRCQKFVREGCVIEQSQEQLALAS